MTTLRGVHNYHPRDLQTAVQFLSERSHEYPFGLLVGETFPLEQAESAFLHAQQATGVRVTVVPDRRADA
jgi:alcohol dehydrogenase